MNNVEQHILDAIKELEKRDEQREKLLKISREILRNSRKIVLNIHSENIERSKKIIEIMIAEKKKLDAFKENTPDLYYSGTVTNTLTEYVESLQLYNFISKKRLLDYKELDVDPAIYLLGLADLIGELRRITIGKIKNNHFCEAEEILRTMEKIYNFLKTTILPDALVPGLRRKTDIARNIIENTRKDLLFYKRSFLLSKKLEEVIKNLEVSDTS